MTDPRLATLVEAVSGRDGAVQIAVRAQPGAKRSAVLGMHGARIRIAVQAPPVDGKANEALERFVAEQLGLPRARVAVSAGSSSRDKRLSIDAGLAETLARLAELLPPGPPS